MITISSEKHNKLLNRKELQLDITFTAQIPSKKELQKQLAEQQKTKESLIVIKDIFGVYGDRRAKVRAYIYDDEKALKDIEPKPKEKKAKPEEGAAPAPAAEKKEEKPAEAPKEAPKEQPKPEAKPEEKKEEPKEEKK